MVYFSLEFEGGGRREQVIHDPSALDAVLERLVELSIFLFYFSALLCILLLPLFQKEATN
jgi:hypothetical protein